MASKSSRLRREVFRNVRVGRRQGQSGNHFERENHFGFTGWHSYDERLESGANAHFVEGMYLLLIAVFDFKSNCVPFADSWTLVR